MAIVNRIQQEDMLIKRETIFVNASLLTALVSHFCRGGTPLEPLATRVFNFHSGVPVCVSQIKITTKMTKFTLGEESRGKNHRQHAARIKTGRCKKIISKQYAL